MPKARPDGKGLIAYRIELQEKEREMLDRFLTAASVGEVLKGVGSIVAPFGTAAGLFMAAWMTRDGIEAIEDWFKNSTDEYQRRLEAEYAIYLTEWNQNLAFAESQVEPNTPESNELAVRRMKGPMTIEEYEYRTGFKEKNPTNFEKWRRGLPGPVETYLKYMPKLTWLL